MWSRARRSNVLLEPLAAVVGGQVSDGRITGTYEGFGVEAHTWKGSPTHGSAGVAQASPVEPAGTTHMLRLTLAGAAGGAMWRCRSSPSSLAQDLASRLTAGRLLESFRPGEFRFEDPKSRPVGGKIAGKLAELMMGSVADTPEHVQQALIAAGLFEELSALRWGPEPYLPMAAFMPSAGEMAHARATSPGFARYEARLTERLRAAGMPGLESVIEQQMDELDQATPGQLEFDVQVPRGDVPSAEQFAELLRRTARIAEINRAANPPTAPRAGG